MKHKHSTTESGYTILETMVAVSVFMVVITTGLGSLLNANLLQHKSEDMRSIIDNLSFIMEDMSRNLRTGYNYQCFDSSQSLLPSTIGAPRSCPDGWAIAFESQGGNPATYADQWVYYISGDGKIFKSINGANNYDQLTPDEVVIDQVSGFSVLGAPGKATDSQQPFVIIRLVGSITYKSTATPFSVQTSVSQRLVDI
ncbi:MAG: type II secretion system protein [Candidatus Paceibacterota bacterium]